MRTTHQSVFARSFSTTAKRYKEQIMNSNIEGKALETDDFVTHRNAWRDALLIALDNGGYTGQDDGPLSWDICIQAFDEAFALYAPGSIPDGFRSNREAWRLALTIARDLAKVHGPDVDDKAYWEHEIRAFDRAFASVGISLADGKLPELTELGVEDLRSGDKVDLNSCPFLKESASADFEFAVVESVELETAGCVVVSYEDHAVVGYPVGCKLKVSSETLGSRKLPETSHHAAGAGPLSGQVEAAPDLIATLDRAESFIAGFEGDQLQDGIDDLMLEIRTTKGALKAQQKLQQSKVEMIRSDGTTFPERVRFNWGFHDGTAEAERAKVRDMESHQDRAYVHGYVRGVLAWKNLGYRPESSDEAWSMYQGHPLVSPVAGEALVALDINSDPAVIEARVVADYQHMLGKTVLVRVVSGYRGSDSVDIRLHPPAKVRIATTEEASLKHWNDDWCDPYWEVEVVEPHPQLVGIRSTWISGSCYHLNGQQTNASDVISVVSNEPSRKPDSPSPYL
ncbi:hypothetical protein C6P88_02590 [Burkholderia contaminans]|nr:hypothetical protein C6P88_02590 [Burkholderia contaminans]